MNGVPLSRWMTFWSIALIGCAVDLATKQLVFAWIGMPGGETWWIVEGIFGIQTSLNDGALFGFGRGKVFWFAALSVLAAIGINYWLFVARAAVDRWLTVALGFVMAGVLGNLHDRLGLWAPENLAAGQVFSVRDWILVCYYNVWTWPNFNIADSLLVCGAAMLCWHAFVAEAAQRRAGVSAGTNVGDQRAASV